MPTRSTVLQSEVSGYIMERNHDEERDEANLKLEGEFSWGIRYISIWNYRKRVSMISRRAVETGFWIGE
jgi:hypothetical protein